MTTPVIKAADDVCAMLVRVPSYTRLKPTERASVLGILVVRFVVDIVHVCPVPESRLGIICDLIRAISEKTGIPILPEHSPGFWDRIGATAEGNTRH